jgi:hypothetical protein
MQLSVQLEYNDGSKQTKTLDFNIKLSEWKENLLEK